MHGEERKKMLSCVVAFAHIRNDVNKTHFTFHGTATVMCANHAKGKHSCCADRDFFFCAIVRFWLYCQNAR